MYNSKYKVNELISDIKKRWKTRAIKQGFAITILTLLILASLFLFLTYLFEIPALYQTVMAAAASIIVLTVAVKFLLLSGIKNITDKQIALYVEEKIPELEDRINSAVELNKASPDKFSNRILDKLIDDAAKKANKIDITTVIDRKKERILYYLANSLLAIAFILFYTFAEEILDFSHNIQLTAHPIDEFKQDFIKIIPGDVEIEKGESQEIVVELKKNSSENLVLNYKQSDGVWRKEIMQKGMGEPVFLHQFMNIQESIGYFVEVGEKRSDEYSISLYEFPRVENIDLAYKYPAYTGIPERKEESTGDIRGLTGTEVTLTVTTSGTVDAGDMVVLQGQNITLKREDDNLYTAKFTLDDPDSYHIKLTDSKGKNNKFPEEFLITPLEDERPLIMIQDPQRDLRVNPVEEVLMSVNVTDDFGVKDVSLSYSVNGEEEQTITLAENPEKNTKDTDGSHVIYLEDFELQPGDVITYHFEANDYYHTESPEATDLYFIEIIPYDTKFTQVNNQGGQGQGGGQPRSQPVVEQQRIIAATWKLYKDRADKSESAFEADRGFIVQAQSNLKDQINERVNSTAFSRELIQDETSKQIVELFREAAKDMEDAVNELSETKLREAMTPERKALNKLLKAEALNNEKRVQQNRSQSSSGGQSSQERITELEDLELDITKDKYEVQEQRQQEQQNQEVDEALEKIKELSQRQQKLAEQSEKSLREEEDRRTADRLKREQEQLRNEAEDLARQMRQDSRNNPQITPEMQRRMDQVTNNMQKAEEAIKNEDFQEAMSKQQQAMNDLTRMQQDLSATSNDNLKESIEKLTDDFNELKEKERQLGNDIKKTYDDNKQLMNQRPEKDDLDRLSEKREEIINDLEKIEEDAAVIEDNNRRENPKVSNDLRNFQKVLDEEKLRQKMSESDRAIENGWLNYANFIEDEIKNGINKLENRLKNLESELPMAEEEQLTRKLDDAKELLTKLEDIQDQMSNSRQQQGNQDQQSQQPQSGQEQSEQQQNQQGRQQNQQGQQQGRQQNQQQSGQQSGQQQNQQNQQNQNPQGGSQGNPSSSDMQRQITEARQMLQRMMRENRNNQDMQQALRSAYSSLGRLSFQGVLIDEAAEEFFNENVYDPISRLEEQLLRSLDVIEMDKKLYGSRKADVPPKYKRLVDKYYESLSKTKKKDK
ncbi:MAG: hypothetical protein GY863_08915 [bacterium]|nr:hypothetical protein [bacterium]